MNKLTDLELCYKLAEIVDYKGWEKMSTRGLMGIFNPLTDEALLGGLIRKYIQSYRYDVIITPDEETEVFIFKAFYGDEVRGGDYARCALEAIVDGVG